MTGGVAALIDRSLISGDNELVARLRREAAPTQAIVDAGLVVVALDVVERAAAQLSHASLRAFAERVGRAHARAMARLRRSDRLAVRQAVLEAAASEEGRC